MLLFIASSFRVLTTIHIHNRMQHSWCGPGLNTRGRGDLPLLPTLHDLDLFDPNLWLRAKKVNMQKPVIQPGSPYFYPFGQNKRFLELAGSNATVQVDPLLPVFHLTATDDKLVVLLRDLEVLHPKTGNGQSNAQAIRGYLLDVIRWVTIARTLAGTFQHLFQMIKTQKHGRAKKPA